MTSSSWVRLPHARCREREQAIRRVAGHRPVHETIATMSGIRFEIQDEGVLTA